MIRPSLLAFALSAILLAGNAAAQQPPAAAPPAAAPPPAAPPAAAPPAAAPPPAAPPPAALPPGYYPPPPAYPPAYGQQPYGVRPLGATERFSVPMMATGIVLTSMGAVALVAGSLAWTIKDGIVCESGTCNQHGSDTVLMVAGGIATLAGITLIIIGNRQVPVKQEQTALVPTISISPRGASLTFTF